MLLHSCFEVVSISDMKFIILITELNIHIIHTYTGYAVQACTATTELQALKNIFYKPDYTYLKVNNQELQEIVHNTIKTIDIITHLVYNVLISYIIT